jgi:hypothetical protein
LLKQRLADEVNRLGYQPETFFAFSHEDIEGFKPLNTPEGAKLLLDLIEKIGGVDFVILDSVMCLLIGSMSEEEPWAKVMTLVRSLTKKEIGQLWVHHTGHDKSRGFGTSTREWQLDNVLHMEAVEMPNTDVSFRLYFQKARERTPQTRADFQDTAIALINDTWESRGENVTKPGRVSPLALKFFNALTDALNDDDQIVWTLQGRRAVTNEVWVRECELLGLIDPKAKDNAKRAMFYKYRRELIAANRVAHLNNLTWLPNPIAT